MKCGPGDTSGTILTPFKCALKMKKHRCTVDLNDVRDHTGLNIDIFSAAQIQGFTYSPDFFFLNSKKTNRKTKRHHPD